MNKQEKLQARWARHTRKGYMSLNLKIWDKGFGGDGVLLFHTQNLSKL